MSPDPMRDLEVCVIEKTSGLLFEWGGGQTVNLYDVHEYTTCILNGTVPKCLDAYMMGEDKPTYEDFISSVHDHLDLIDGTDDGEEAR